MLIFIISTFMKVVFLWSFHGTQQSLAKQSVEYSLKGLAGVFPLHLCWDRNAFVVHLPVKRPSHGVSCLRIIAKVVVVDHVDHRTHDAFPVLGDSV